MSFLDLPYVSPKAFTSLIEIQVEIYNVYILKKIFILFGSLSNFR
jgi:hypothetical protein